MNWRELVKDYFTFTRKERIGLLIVVIVTVGIWLIPHAGFFQTPKLVSADSSWIAAAKKLERHVENSADANESGDDRMEDVVYDRSAGGVAIKPQDKLFYFDPNTLSIEGWKKLGIHEKTINTIQKYLAKGGHFYKPEDLKRIYGIHLSDYERLRAYVKITHGDLATNVFNSDDQEKNQRANNRPPSRTVDVNVGDTTDFIALPGIGTKLAGRIVNFRDKLGGFYSVDQVAETYGLSDSIFQKIKSLLRLNNNSVRKLNINTATKDELKQHPYIRWALANAIVEFRNQHGAYTSIDDLLKLSAVTDEVFKKIKQYIVIE